jgi:hypothetical protein
MLPVQAGHGYGNFHSHSRAAPCRLSGENFHMRYHRVCTCPDLLV